ncbi:hypothetical protein ACTXGQ_02320 [Marinobacter sp. 1Y8]
MTSGYEETQQMLAWVARALGDDLLQETVFVGGCTTALLLTDDTAREDVRHTKDVDLIVDVIGPHSWGVFKDKLRERGFKERMDIDAPTCALFLQDLRVDFMPDDPTIVGHTNRWYGYALKHANLHEVALGEARFEIQVVSPLSFVATKLEAYLGRGNGDVSASHDLEDMVLLFFGREELVEEIQRGEPEILDFVARQLRTLLEHSEFGWVVQSTVRGDARAEDYLFERLEAIADMSSRG